MTRTQPWDGQGAVVKLPQEAIDAWVDWEPVRDPVPPFTVRQSTIVRQAFMDGWMGAARVNKGPAADKMAVALEGAADALHVAADKLNAAGFDMESADLLDAEHDARSNLAAYRESVS